MSQLARISRGVRAALRNLPSTTFLNVEKRASSATSHGLPTDWKSNPWKICPSYLNPNGITNPRLPFSSSSLPYTTSTDKDSSISKVKDKDDELISCNELLNLTIATVVFLCSVFETWKSIRPKHSKHAQNSFQDSSSTRSYTMVHKQTTAYGMWVDLTKYNGFDELISRLDEMFRFNGELMSPSNSWLVLFTDSEGYYNVVEGDLEWEDFCNRVCTIFIYTQEEVEEMNPSIFRSFQMNLALSRMEHMFEETKSCSGAN